VIAECRWLSFLKYPKHYARNHFNLALPSEPASITSKPALFSSFTLSICARRVRTTSCHDLLEAADSASLCLQVTLQSRAAVSADKARNAGQNRITELLKLAPYSKTKSTSDTPLGPGPFQTSNYLSFKLACTPGALSDFRYSMMAKRSSGESAGPTTPFPRGPSLNS